jgi:hypothetical protein
VGLLLDQTKLVRLAISVVCTVGSSAAREQRTGGQDDDGSDCDHGGRDLFTADANDRLRELRSAPVVFQAAVY